MMIYHISMSMPCWTLNVTVFHMFIDALFRRWKLNRGPASDYGNIWINPWENMSWEYLVNIKGPLMTSRSEQLLDPKSSLGYSESRLGVEIPSVYGGWDSEYFNHIRPFCIGQLHAVFLSVFEMDLRSHIR